MAGFLNCKRWWSFNFYLYFLGGCIETVSSSYDELDKELGFSS
jgi:hypothetical protein